MILNGLFAILGIIMGLLYSHYRNGKISSLEDTLMTHMIMGRRVILCIDTEAFIYELVGDRIVISKAEADFITPPQEVSNVGSMDSMQSDQSPQHFSELP